MGRLDKFLRKVAENRPAAAAGRAQPCQHLGVDTGPPHGRVRSHRTEQARLIPQTRPDQRSPRHPSASTTATSTATWPGS